MGVFSRSILVATVFTIVTLFLEAVGTSSVRKFLVRHLIYSTSLYRSFDSQPHMTCYTALNAKISVSQ